MTKLQKAYIDVMNLICEEKCPLDVSVEKAAEYIEDRLSKNQELKAFYETVYTFGFRNGYKAFSNDLYWDIVASKRMGKVMTIDDLMDKLEHIFGDWIEDTHGSV